MRDRGRIALDAGQTALGAATVVVLLGLVWLTRDSLALSAIALVLVVFILTMIALGLNRMGYLLILLGMITAPLTELTVIPGVTLVTIGDVCFVLGFAFLLPTLLRTHASPPSMYLVGSGLLLVVGLLASVRSSDFVGSINLLMRLVATAILFPVVFTYWRPDLAMCTRLAKGYVVGGLITSGYGLIEGPAAGDLDTGRYNGLSEHPNALGLVCLLAVSLVPFIVSQTRPARRWLWWLLGAGDLAGMWLSGSRATLLALAVLVLLYPAIERSVKALGVLVAAAGVGLVFAGRLFNAQSDSPVGRLLGGGSADGSDAQRQDAFHLALTQFRAHPLLGNGFQEVLSSHVIYLEIAVSAGLIGLIGFLMIMWTGFRPLFTAPQPVHRIAYPVLAYLLTGLISDFLWDRYIWCVLALSFVVAAQNRERVEPDPHPTAEPVLSGTAAA